MLMRSIKKERLSQMVTDAINEIIELENLQAGDKLYSENQLSQRLEVSRSSIREAVRMLEVTGIVSVYQGKGIFINDPDANEIPLKSWVVDNTRLLKEHFEIRSLLEPHAAREAAENSSEKDIESLTLVYHEFCKDLEHENIEKAIASDSAFHQLIAKISRNRTLNVLMKTMGQTLNEGWIASLNTPGRLELTVVEHGEILAAIAAHDPEAAAEAMRLHLVTALLDIQDYTNEQISNKV
jgi:GntR family transcriptional repressor for pyruvate dehydrogenase complex